MHALGPGTGRVLKDRWSRPGWAPMLQVFPLALIVGILAATVSLSIPASYPQPHKPVAHIAAPKIMPAPQPATLARQVYSVAVEKPPCALVRRNRSRS